MNGPARDQRLRTGLLFGSAVLALANLPTEQFPLPWLLAFALPTTLFGFLHRGGTVRIWTGIVFLVTQLGAILFTMHGYGSLPRITSTLGCILVPMMVFLALRPGSHTTLQALSLAFCLFLIGIILGDPSAWLCLGFLSCASATMYVDASLVTGERRYSWRSGPESWYRKLRNLVAITATVVVGCFLMFQCLKLLPVPGDKKQDGGTGQTKSTKDRSDVASVGLSNQFSFNDDGGGTLLNLREEKILEAHSTDGRPIARDLYLRYSYFDIADLSNWSRAGGRRETLQKSSTLLVRPALAGIPTRTIEIEFIAPSSPLIFAPPGLVRLTGLSNYTVDLELGFMQLPGVPSPHTSYSVTYQDLTPLAESVRIDPKKWRSMIRLSNDLERPSVQETFRAILAQANVRPLATVRSGEQAIAIAEAITDVIQSRCTYDLKTPTGPYRDQVLNFLRGDRRGYCMHFASATAICMRMAGVPCRIGVGLQGGRETTDPRLREYGRQNAHAWVEIPMSGIGWIVFDPSPSADVEFFQSKDDSALDSAPEATDELTAEAADDGESLKRAIALFAKPLDYPIVWIILAAMILLPFLGRRQPTDRVRVSKVRPEAMTARRLLGKILAYLGRRGVVRRHSQTLESFASRLDREQSATKDVTDAFHAYQEIRFGGRDFDDARRRRLERGVRTAKKFSDESQTSTREH